MLTDRDYPEISTYLGEYTPIPGKCETLAEELLNLMKEHVKS